VLVLLDGAFLDSDVVSNEVYELLNRGSPGQFSVKCLYLFGPPDVLAVHIAAHEVVMVGAIHGIKPELQPRVAEALRAHVTQGGVLLCFPNYEVFPDRGIQQPATNLGRENAVHLPDKLFHPIFTRAYRNQQVVLNGFICPDPPSPSSSSSSSSSSSAITSVSAQSELVAWYEDGAPFLTVDRVGKGLMVQVNALWQAFRPNPLTYGVAAILSPLVHFCLSQLAEPKPKTTGK